MDTPQKVQHRLVTFEKGEYDIYLVLDSREIHGRVDRSYFQKHLASNGIRVLTRSLPIGDVVWLARPRDGSPEEIVLDYIVERKVYEDLASSFRDGRYKNQKLRMESCGLKNKIYIIQRSYGYRSGKDYAINSSMKVAIIKSQLVQDFFAKQTDSVHESVEYLVRLSRKIEDVYQGKQLVAIDIPENAGGDCGINPDYIPPNHSMTYKLFVAMNRGASSDCLGKVWIRQLMSLRGVSLEKALTISEGYPTMNDLLDAFDRCETSSQRVWLLVKIKRFGPGAIGQALARRIVDQMCSREYKY